MKRFVLMGITSIAMSLVAATGCNWDDSKSEAENGAKLVFEFLQTKAQETPVDDFTLKVCSLQGDTCYIGRFGDRPQSLNVKPGTYEVSLYSKFDSPAFEAPQYGDIVEVNVKKREQVTVNLICRLINSGLSFSFSDAFRKEYGNSTIQLSQAGEVLEYPVSQRNVAYFNPGRVFLLLNGEVALYKDLERGELRHLNLDAVHTSSDVGFTVSIDTDTPVTDEDFTLEEPIFGADQACLFDIGLTARVEGIIVGAVKSSKLIPSGTAGLDVTSNIFIATSADAGNIKDGMPVELTNSFKGELNLVDHPEFAGKRIAVKGTILPYFGVKGIKNLTEYEFIY
ncbi:MAG: DUF4493 domain-containing protein [Bacteroidales bacterium]|nr:DUF4493 domain-containing protein [Candidatus Cacconaster equi]